MSNTGTPPRRTAPKEKIDIITDRLSKLPLRVMELRNKEMHFHQMEREGPLHDKKNCPFCKMEYKQK